MTTKFFGAASCNYGPRYRGWRASVGELPPAHAIPLRVPDDPTNRTGCALRVRRGKGLVAQSFLYAGVSPDSMSWTFQIPIPAPGHGQSFPLLFPSRGCTARYSAAGMW
jgi:hypothetical protein